MLIMPVMLVGFMTSPGVPLHIGVKCGDESNFVLLIDQVSVTNYELSVNVVIIASRLSDVLSQLRTVMLPTM